MISEIKPYYLKVRVLKEPNFTKRSKGVETLIRYKDKLEETLKQSGEFEVLDYLDKKEASLIKDPQKPSIRRITKKIFTTKGQAEMFIEFQPLFYDKSCIWWLWDIDKTVWKIVDEVDILNMIDVAVEKEVMNNPRKLGEIFMELKKVGRMNIPKPLDKKFILFNNQLVNLDNPQEIITPSPKHFVTNQIPHKLGSSDKTPTIDKIFAEWVGDKYVKTLYQILAYCLYVDYPIHIIFYLFGEGLNGKSCFLNLLREFVGDDNCCSTDLEFLLASRFEKCRIHKKLIVTMGETNLESIKNTSLLKSLSGNDLIGFEYKRKDPFEDVNYAKLIISTNNLPPTLDKTIGFYRRMLIVDFPNKFSEKKDILNDIPSKEYENLCCKCLGILKDLLKVREFHMEGSISEKIDRYEDRSNPLGKFLKDCIEESDEFITVNQFKKKFDGWCRENRFRELGDVTINSLMKARGYTQSRQRIEWYEGDKPTQKQARVWGGITWK